MSEKPEEVRDSLVYIPVNAKINEKNVDMAPPETYYENRKAIIDKDVVKKIVKGEYGRDN